MEPLTGFEPVTHGLRYRCSTTELQRLAVHKACVILALDTRLVPHLVDPQNLHSPHVNRVDFRMGIILVISEEPVIIEDVLGVFFFRELNRRR